MKRIIVIAVLASAFSLFAQQPKTAPSGQPAAQSGAPAGKRPPQAKTKPEFEAYNAAAALTDPAAMEKAADDFAAKYPDSELKILLYKTTMHAYQVASNPDKMLELGDKVLKLDPDDPEANIGVAEVLAERTRDTDLDKDQRLDRAMKSAQHASETVDTDVAIPAGTSQQKIDEYKGLLKSSAFSIIGTIQFNREQFADSEKSFQKSIDAYPSQPDPVVVLRLALSLDKQNRYPEALKVANRAVDMTEDSTNAGKLARQERDRLVQLTGGIAPVSATPPASTPAAPKN